MRQAGRCLPEYRALKEKYSFLELVENPELAAEVTLQPIRRFGFDAAILFSDILVVPQALGQGFDFADQGGVKMDFTLCNASDIDRLHVTDIAHKLQYVAEALRLIKGDLGGRTALLGFAGSPWTLANFMIEGGSAREFTRTRGLFYQDERLFAHLLDKLTQAVIAFLQLQIDAGVDAIQIFDSLGGVLAPESFQAASGRWIKEIVFALERQVPVIIYSRGTHASWNLLANLGAQVIGIDWMVSLSDVRGILPRHRALQGNLDPVLLKTTPEAVVTATQRLLQEMRGEPGYIMNLGHGTPPDAKVECISALLDTVRSAAVPQFFAPVSV
jgi:uroporphyrinogen decarboxylase